MREVVCLKVGFRDRDRDKVYALPAHSHPAEIPFSGCSAMDGACCIVGLGDPVMDVVVRVAPEFLSSITQQPGGCIPVDSSEMDALLRSCTEQHTPLR